MKIGVISDTHGYLDPQILKLFSDVDHILHAGDIGTPRIIFELEQIAPVTAVLGNTDSDISFNEIEMVQLQGRRFLLHHIVDPRAPGDIIKQRILREKPDVVVFGHTHKPFNQVIGKTLYFNPGYAGKQRFNLERSIAILHCDPDSIHAELAKL
ncbi:MAG: metallophosphoesterase family protein [Verrucomicrobia bacterium]|nr:metallophosphoesterase family protein [Verrucomicrobiota bacterium]